jgi:hypothetical protein
MMKTIKKRKFVCYFESLNLQDEMNNNKIVIIIILPFTRLIRMNKTVRVNGSKLLKTIIKRFQHTPSLCNNKYKRGWIC